MDISRSEIVLAVAIPVVLLIICNSKLPIIIKIRFKSIDIEIGTKKENK